MKNLLAILALGAATTLTVFDASAIPLGDAPFQHFSTELNELEIGWSVRNSLLGRTVFNERGDSIGEVTDLIVALDSAVSYLIIDASDFVGLEHHEVAVPFEQVRKEDQRVILPGAHRAPLVAMPGFRYATDQGRRAHFVARVERRVAEAKARIAMLDRDAVRASAATRSGLEQQRNRIARDLEPVEKHLASLSSASVARWEELTSEVERALEDLRISFMERRLTSAR